MDFFCDCCDDHVSASSQVCTECGEPLVDNPEWDWEDDGQPDEAQEWFDFDPDCQKKSQVYPLTMTIYMV